MRRFKVEMWFNSNAEQSDVELAVEMTFPMLSEELNRSGKVVSARGQRYVVSIEEPVTHYLLSDVEELTVLCNNFLPNDKYTLEDRLLTCTQCRVRRGANKDDGQQA